MDYDYIIIGSGFGGSISALRLAEKGYSVAVLEQGRRISNAAMDNAQKSMRHLLWKPELGMKGFFSQDFFRDLFAIRGICVGGGSIVYAAVLLEPRDDFFVAPEWNSLGVDWKKELKKHYLTARKMLGIAENPYYTKMDEYLYETAKKMNAEKTFGQVPQGIYFGKPGVTVKDPFFKGKGPQRSGCTKCGSCLTGCSHNAKNSLDKNYLYFAEKLGCEVLPERKVTLVTPIEGGYSVQMKHPFRRGTKYQPLSAKNVVFSAGVLGSLRLLMHCREAGALPKLSAQLGKVVRTNSEAIKAITCRDKNVDLTEGATISTHFYPDSHTHITQNRLSPGYNFLRWYTGPLIDGKTAWARSLKTILHLFLHPLISTYAIRAKNWYKRATILTVMQHKDSQISFAYGRRLLTLFARSMYSVKLKGKSVPAYIPEANAATKYFAEVSDGVPHSSFQETLGNVTVTAHLLGGCQIGKSVEGGVIDTNHQVFGYPGLYVIDGSAIPVNVGVNPSLTISALSERAMSLIPAKKKNREKISR